MYGSVGQAAAKQEHESFLGEDEHSATAADIVSTVAAAPAAVSGAERSHGPPKMFLLGVFALASAGAFVAGAFRQAAPSSSLPAGGAPAGEITEIEAQAAVTAAVHEDSAVPAHILAAAAAAAAAVDDGAPIGSDDAAVAADSLGVSVENAVYGAPAGLQLYSTIESLAEPHRTTNLAIASASLITSNTYSWSVTLSGANEATVVSDDVCGGGATVDLDVGSAVSHVFQTPTAIYAVSATEYDEGGEATGRTVTFDVVCKYVRREIRRLTADDREVKRGSRNEDYGSDRAARGA